MSVIRAEHEKQRQQQKKREFPKFPKPTAYEGLIVIMIAFGLMYNLYLTPTTVTDDRSWFENTSLLSAEGDFNRVELILRHKDDSEGIFLARVDGIEGRMLGPLRDKIICEYGVPYISHNENKIGEVTYYYRAKQNYLFYLYVYSGELHIREAVSVLGGTEETFVYENVTVIIELSTNLVSDIRTIDVTVFINMFFVIFFIAAVLGDMNYRDKQKRRNRRGWE